MDDRDPCLSWARPALLLAVSLGVVLVSAGAALAATAPTGGAVARPAKLTLRAPFPCGIAIRVSCAYGPGCSSFHKSTSSATSANDYYALDLVRDETGSGQDKPVTPVADGRVLYAAWATGGWASYGQIVLLEHDVGDGHQYVSLYAHLNRISVTPGQQVTVADAVGTMGGSSNHQLAGFATHLHFALYRDAKHDGGPYGGAAVVPEPLGGVENLAPGKAFTVQCDAEPPAPPVAPPADRPGRPDAGPTPDRGASPSGASDAGVADRGGSLPAADVGRGTPPGGGDGADRLLLSDTLYGGCSASAPAGRATPWLSLAFAILGAACGARRRRSRRH